MRQNISLPPKSPTNQVYPIYQEQSSDAQSTKVKEQQPMTNRHSYKQIHPPKNNRFRSLSKRYKTNAELHSSSTHQNDNLKIRRILTQCEQWQLKVALQKKREQKKLRAYDFKQKNDSDGEVQEAARVFIKQQQDEQSYPHLKEFNPLDLSHLNTPKKKKFQASPKIGFPRISHSKSLIHEQTTTPNLKDKSDKNSGERAQKGNKFNEISSPFNKQELFLTSNDEERQQTQLTKRQQKISKLSFIDVVLNRYKQTHQPMNASQNKLVMHTSSIETLKSQPDKKEVRNLNKVIRHLNNSPKIKSALIPNCPVAEEMENFADKIVKISPKKSNEHQKQKITEIKTPIEKQLTHNKLNKKNSFMMIDPSKIGSYDEIIRQRRREDESKRLLVLKSVIRDSIKKKNEEIRKNFNRKNISM